MINLKLIWEFQMDNITTTFKNNDCIIALQEFIDDGVQVDSVVTDPPYELGFMGKSWDSTGIAFQKDVWELVFKVLKPGGHLLSFGGSRTYHRMAVAIEDAGFEIRDQIMWLYGSGFPKSHNIGKAIDKKPNADLNAFSKALKERRIELGYSLMEADKLITGGTTMYSFLEGRKNNDVYPPNKEYWEKIKEHFGMDSWEKIIENNLKVVGEKDGNFGYQKDGKRWKNTTNETELTSETAKQYEGWGTALKPAHEPIVMARKPLSEKTVADNVLKHGTGGINIDGCRVEGDRNAKSRVRKAGSEFGQNSSWNAHKNVDTVFDPSKGRFPANIIHDGSEEVISGFPVPDKGSAARFFYCAKASKKERGIDNKHPTVKPIALMKYLCRLVTPKNGTVLDPFMGSGSTGIAAKEENYNFIGIELNKEYYDIAIARININPEENKPIDKHQQPTQQQLPLQELLIPHPELNDFFGSC